MPRLKKVKSIYKLDPGKRSTARKKRTAYLKHKGKKSAWG